MSGILILAHQDDEVFFLSALQKFAVSHVVYLTDGVRKDAAYSSDIRSTEVSDSWALIQPNVEIIELGKKLKIKDGKVHEYLSQQLFSELRSIVGRINPRFVLTTLNDGGHQDHDAVFLISRMIKPDNATLIAIPSYRANFVFRRLYRVLKLPSNFPHSYFKIKGSLDSSILAYRVMRLYPTQKITWLGLGPMTLIRLLIGFKALVCEDRLCRHIPDSYLYEIRHRAKSEDLKTFESEIQRY